MNKKTKMGIDKLLKKMPSTKVLLIISVGIIVMLLAYIAILLLSTR